jgi:2-methylcitrate dehydratase PrpD
MDQVTERITRFICSTEFENIPPEVVEAGKLHILDTLGVLFAGSREEISGIVREYIRASGHPGECTLMAQGIKTSAQYAAFGNGVMAHALDFDDYEWPSMAHPSAVILPAVFALGEKIGAGGKQCLQAYLVGLEGISRIGCGVNPSHYDKGWHATGTLGPLGAAAASAKLLHCDAERVKMALGIASSMSAGLRGNFGTMTKPFHAGHASRSGVESAVLASMGFTADKAILERKMGFCSLFTEENRFDLGKIVRNLGDPFSIISPGIGIKPYPSCAATHSVLDGVFSLIKQHGMKAGDVDRVECGIFYLYPSMLIHSEPRTGLEGKFSLEYCVAAALIDREINVGKFTDEQVNRPEVRTMIKRIKAFVTDEVGRVGTYYPGATVRIHLKDGTSCFTRVESRRGSPLNPLSREEVIEKFMANSSMLYDRPKADELVNAVMHLEELSDIRVLIRKLDA